MMNREFEQKLAQALNHAAPDDLDDVLSQCGAGERTVIEMKNITSSKKKRWGWLVAVLALALIGGGGGLFYQNTQAVASVISLDVNPSIELRVNRTETVLSCTAMNEDAAVILSDMGGGTDLEGTKLEVAVNAIVGALLRNGYLDSISSAILISVEDNDQSRAERIKEELVAVVDSILQGTSAQPTVYSQNVTVDDGLNVRAQSNNISQGKAYLVNQVITLNSSLEFDALAVLSVEELQDLIEIGAPGMPIGMDAAKQVAENYAGTLELTSDAVREVDPDLDDRVPHYEVELYVPGLGEFEYKIDAFTGDVLSGQRDIITASQPTVSDNPIGNDPDTSDSQPIPSSGGNQTADIGADTAKAVALKHAGLSESQVSRLKVERDWDDGRLEYEVEFFYNDTEYEYTIDGTTGEVRGYDTEFTRSGQTQVPAGDGTATATDIGADAAKAVALNHAGLSESQVSHLKIERDWDDGRLEYEVEFKFNGYEYEYTISGMAGTILEYEVDWDD